MACRPVRLGKASSSRASAPATAGEAKEVPFTRQQPSSSQSTMTSTPGADRKAFCDTPARLEKAAICWAWSCAPVTMMAPAKRGSLA